jgi:hypothetical protein
MQTRFFQRVSGESGAKIGAFCRLPATACGNNINVSG